MATPAQVVFSLIDDQASADHIPYLQLLILYPEAGAAISISVDVPQVSTVPVRVLRAPVRCSIRVKVVPTAVAVPCEVPKLMDMESMQPRLQAINGPLDEAAFGAQL